MEAYEFVDQTWTQGQDDHERERVTTLAKEIFPKWGELNREERIAALERLLYADVPPHITSAHLEGLHPSELALTPTKLYSEDFLKECGWK